MMSEVAVSILKREAVTPTPFRFMVSLSIVWAVVLPITIIVTAMHANRFFICVVLVVLTFQTKNPCKSSTQGQMIDIENIYQKRFMFKLISLHRQVVPFQVTDGYLPMGPVCFSLIHWIAHYCLL